MKLKRHATKFLRLSTTAGTLGIFLLSASVNAQEKPTSTSSNSALPDSSTQNNDATDTKTSKGIHPAIVDNGVPQTAPLIPEKNVKPTPLITANKDVKATTSVVTDKDVKPTPVTVEKDLKTTTPVVTDKEVKPTPVNTGKEVKPTPVVTDKDVKTTTPVTTQTGENVANPLLPFPASEVRILTPTINTVLENPSTSVILQFIGVNEKGAPQEVELRVNGVLVNSDLIGRSEVDSINNLTTQTWYGIPLNQGDNTITAQIKGLANAKVTSVKLQVSGAPTKLKISTVESRITANGKSTATIQGQLLDAKGNKSNQDAMITLVTSDGEIIGADQDKDASGFQVLAKKGQFTATLRSGNEAKTVYIRATNELLKLEAFTTIQFTTDLRPSLVTGVIDLRIGSKGTDYYGSFRDFLPTSRDNSTQINLRSSVFATGKVGNWLFTGAYNSDRPLNQTCNNNSRLFKDVTSASCDPTYTIYGDSSTVTNTAPSQDSLYVRFERSSRIPGAEPDYGMWGDYSTTEFATRSQQFTATTRQLHGFKLNYNLGNLQVSGFYGNNVQGFQRDTIAPDGTSGYYFLSRRLLVGGSESLSIELEQLNNPGVVTQTTTLNRGVDYDIDYDRGTLLFRKPILRTDLDPQGQVLVRRIVATYQYQDPGSDNSIYGGRARYFVSRKANQETWFAGSYVKQKQGIRDFELYGADALISVGPKLQLIAEYAHSLNDSELMGTVTGSAYRIEANSQITSKITARAYVQSTDVGFANNATTSFVAGQTRYGSNINAQVTQSTNVRVQYDHQDNFGIAPRPLTSFQDLFTPRTEAVPGSKVDNSVTTISAGIDQRIGKINLGAELIHLDREDRLATSPLSSNSDQLRTRLSVPITSRLLFQAQNETTISASQDTVNSDRTVLGLNWLAYQGVSISLAQQFFHSGPLKGNAITSLNFTGDYKLGSDTTLTGRYSILGGANAITGQGAVGLNQRWAISPGLRLNASYEHIFANMFSNTASGLQFAQPVTVGQAASSIGVSGGDSYSLGLEYNDNPGFQASARYEHRTSSGATNNVISASVTGKVSSALTTLFRYQQANYANQTVTGLSDTINIKLGLAYRNPKSDKFNALLRYEYRKNPAVIPDTILLGTGTGSEDQTVAAEAIYAPNWRWEFYGKYALRNSSTYFAKDLIGSTTTSLAQLRATYRLGFSMDVVGEARFINQFSTGYSETGFVAELGYYLTPNLRLAGGYSSGSAISGDLVGDRSSSGFYGGLTVKLNELFSGFGLQKAVPRQHEESIINAKAKPAPLPLAKLPESLHLDVAQKLNFGNNEPTLNNKSINILDSLALILKEYPKLTVELQGYLATLAHTDTTDIDTQRLANARLYLISKGVVGNQIVIRSLGKRPEVDTTDNSENVALKINGDSEIFLSMATRLKSGGAVSPILNTLQSMVTLPEVASLPATVNPSPENSKVEPGIPVAMASTGNQRQADHSINFSLDANNPQTQSTLDDVANKLQKNPNTSVEIQGYITASNNNASVEIERVMGVRSYLMDKGVKENQIIIRELDGSLQASNNNGQNNRVDLILANNTEGSTTVSEDTSKPTIISSGTTPEPVALKPTNVTNTSQSKDSVNFAIDANITAQSQQVLDRIAMKLQTERHSSVQIQGYIAAGGKNSDLEMERVMAIRTYLMDKGIDSQQIILSALDNQELQANNTLAENNKIDLILSSTVDGSTTVSEDTSKPTIISSGTTPEPVALKPTNVTNTSQSKNSVNFAIDANITAQSQQVLDRIAMKLQTERHSSVQIQGYIAAGGKNSDLEMERVMAIRTYLMDKGIDSQQIILSALDNQELQANNTLAENNKIDLILSSTVDGSTTVSEDTSKPTIISSGKTPEPMALKPTNVTNTSQPKDSVNFAIDANITAQSQQVLDRIAMKLQTERHTSVKIQGYIAAGGKNSDMEIERVMAIRTYLMEKGIDSQQIIISGLETQDLQANNSQQKLAQNSRVDLILSASENVPIANAVVDPDPALLRLASALNYLMGDEKTATQILLRAMRVTPKEVQGFVVEPSTLNNLSGQSQ